MDAVTCALAFRCSSARAEAAVAGVNTALALAGCTTVARAAMYAAQVGHETLSLFYDQEIWGPTAQQLKYDPASGSDLSRQLGNTDVGDGWLYRGRGRIMVTGKANYGGFSRWVYDRGLVPTSDYFVRYPDLVAAAPWRELAASWYWTVARPGLNAAADRGDVVECTRLINGGRIGLADRRDRYEGALRLGDRLLPDTGKDWLDMASEEDVRRIIREEVPQAVWHHPIPDYYRNDQAPQPAFAMLGWAATHAARGRDAGAAALAELAALRDLVTSGLRTIAQQVGAVSAAVQARGDAAPVTVVNNPPVTRAAPPHDDDGGQHDDDGGWVDYFPPHRPADL